MASRDLLIKVLRGKVGDRNVYHQPTWYTDEELMDQLSLSLLRHNANYTLDDMPNTQVMALCYLAAMEICYDLAAKSAPFSVNSFEGMTVDKTGILNNWITLANAYRDLYKLELDGGLGTEGQIMQGDLTRASLTTGREVPYAKIRPLDPVVLSLVSVAHFSATLSWTVNKNDDFYSYRIYRRNVGTNWTQLAEWYDPQSNTYTDTAITVADRYDYRVDVVRGVNTLRVAMFPLNPQVYNFLVTPSNELQIDVP